MQALPSAGLVNLEEYSTGNEFRPEVMTQSTGSGWAHWKATQLIEFRTSKSDGTNTLA